MKTFFPVQKKYLLLVSGLMWSAVGTMLLSLASLWIQDLRFEPRWVLIVGGIVPGIFVALFGFTHIVQKNIRRINKMDMKVSVFAFQAWYSYIMIAIMMSMGIYIRHSGLIPMILKTPGYYTIGTALSLSSFNYYRAFFRDH